MGFAPETAVFLYACALGAGLGVLYDVFRLLRLVTGGKALLVFLEDLLFSFLAAGCGFLSWQGRLWALSCTILRLEKS